MDPFTIIFVLVMFLQKVEALKCYAGNPSRKHECNSLNHCLIITSRTGRSQWSCDGNSYSQISLCSHLGMDGPRHTIYEAPPISSRESFFQNGNSDNHARSSSNRNERLYFINQQIDPRLSQFVNDGSTSGDGAPEAAALTSRRSGKRCFDAGDLGRICCCSTDYCNGSPKSRVHFSITLLPFLAWFQRS